MLMNLHVGTLMGNEYVEHVAEIEQELTAKRGEQLRYKMLIREESPLAKLHNLDRPDTIIFGLTLIQIAQICMGGIPLILTALIVNTLLGIKGLSSLIFLFIAGLGCMIWCLCVVSKLDGLPRLQWIRIAINFWRLPRLLVLAPEGLKAPDKLTHAVDQLRLQVLSLPWSGTITPEYDENGKLTFGGDVLLGDKLVVRVFAVEGLDPRLMSDGEKAAAAGAWRKYLDAQLPGDGGVQVTARVEPLDLSEQLAALAADNFDSILRPAVKSLTDEVMDCQGGYPRCLYLVLRASGNDALALLDAKQQEMVEALAVLRLGIERVVPSVENGLLPVPTGGKDHSKYVELGDVAHRTWVITKWPRNVHPAWLQSLQVFAGPVDVSLFVSPIGESESMVRVERMKKAYRSTLRLGRGDAGVESSLRDTEEVSRSVAEGDSKLHSLGLYMTAHCDANELPQLERLLSGKARNMGLRIEPATHRMQRGRITTMPLGTDLLGHTRTFESHSASEVLPFATGGFRKTDGILMGRLLATSSNAWPGTPVFVNRWKLLAHNSLTVATSGAGKSASQKITVAREVLAGTEVIIIDPSPDSEYDQIVQALGGKIIRPGDDIVLGARVTTFRAAPSSSLDSGPSQAEFIATSLQTVWEYLNHAPRCRRLIVVDEAFKVCRSNNETRDILWEMVKTSRHLCAGVAIVTQDYSDVVHGEFGDSIVSNSPLVFLLQQKPAAIPALRVPFGLRPGEEQFLVEAGQGQGLLIVGDRRAAIKVKATEWELPQIVTAQPQQLISVAMNGQIRGR